MKILVTAASRHGATAEIADAIAARLQEQGVEVERREPEQVESLDGTDGVVLGSAVYAGRWLQPAVEFAERCADELRERPVWLFSSGPIGGKPPEGPTLPAGITFRSHMVFDGKLDRSGLGLGERAIATVVRVPDGDFRNWDAVNAWADAIAAGTA